MLNPESEEDIKNIAAYIRAIENNLKELKMIR